MADEYDPKRSSVLVGRKRAGGFLPLLLALLAIILIAVVVGLVSCHGDDDKGTTSSSSAPPAGPSVPAGRAGSLTSDAASLLGPTAPTIGKYVAKPAIGRAVKVLSKTGGGFFVGTNAEDRQYVEYGGRVGADEPAHAFEPKVGDSVDLRGPVRPAPENPGRTLKLAAADAKTVKDRGAYVNASSVTPARR